MSELIDISNKCGVVVKVLAWAIGFVIAVGGVAIRTLWKALQSERSDRGQAEKENLLVLKDVTHVLEVVSGGVKTMPKDIKEAIHQTEERIKDMINRIGGEH